MVKVISEIGGKIGKGSGRINTSLLSHTIYVNRDYVANDINKRIFVSLEAAYRWIKEYGGEDRWRIIADPNEDISIINDDNIFIDIKRYTYKYYYDSDELISYSGFAIVGSSEDDEVWTITKIETNADGEVTKITREQNKKWSEIIN